MDKRKIRVLKDPVEPELASPVELAMLFFNGRREACDERRRQCIIYKVEVAGTEAFVEFFHITEH